MIPFRDDNPTRITPYVTVAIIAANVAVFMYQLSLSAPAVNRFIYEFGAIPAVVLGTQALPAQIALIPPFLSIFTSMFLHGGFMHIIGNMLYLWIFGNNIEEAMGHARFFLFYLVSGVLASTAHILSNTASTVPSIGASGAISGVLGAYLLLYPRAQVLTLVPLGFFLQLMYLPAWLILGFWFVLQVISGSLGQAELGGGVAWWAHIGGFVAGVLLVGLFKRREVRFFNAPQYHRSRYVSW
jgi:membrane associated rhomboid family serine protease